MTDSFFVRRQGAAVLKHEILKAYLPPFVGKAGKHFDRVVYLDGCAGTGVYDDGRPGSPLLAAGIAQFFAEKALRRLECIYVEEKRKHHDKLLRSLSSTEHSYRSYNCSVASVIDEVLRIASGAPLFAFLDPFGLKGIPCDALVRKILHRPSPSSRRVPTEALLNFSLVALRRNAGHLKAKTRSPEKAAACSKIVQGLNNSMGGEWWQEVWRSRAPDWEETVVRSYIARIRGGVGQDYSAWKVPVPDHIRDKHPAYHLVLFTAHPAGITTFNEALSKASARYEDYCRRDELAFEYDRDEELVRRLQRNLERLLVEGKPLSVPARFEDIFEGVEGLAGSVHLRRAVQQLVLAGKVREKLPSRDTYRHTIYPSAVP